MLGHFHLAGILLVEVIAFRSNTGIDLNVYAILLRYKCFWSHNWICSIIGMFANISTPQADV